MRILRSVVQQTVCFTRRITTGTRTGDPYAVARHFALCTLRKYMPVLRHTQALVMHIQAIMSGGGNRIDVRTRPCFPVRMIRASGFWALDTVVFEACCATGLDCGGTRGWVRTHTRAEQKDRCGGVIPLCAAPLYTYGRCCCSPQRLTGSQWGIAKQENEKKRSFRAETFRAEKTKNC